MSKSAFYAHKQNIKLGSKAWEEYHNDPSDTREDSGTKKEFSLIEKLIDQDGDGNVVDDIANMGAKFLKGFLK